MSNFIIDKKYFTTKTGKLVLPEDLDSQLDKIANYINKTLIPLIESINFEVTNGITGRPSSMFCNINNNDVGYVYINDVNIDNNLISLSKINKVEKGAVLGSDFSGSIFPVYPSANNQLLFTSQSWFDEPETNIEFRKITSDDIKDNILTSRQLGILESENFANDVFINIIPDDSLSENNLANVSNDKIALDTVDFRHFGVYEGLPYTTEIAEQILLSDFDDNCIDNSKILNGSILPINFDDQLFVSANNIVPMSIKDNHFKLSDPNTKPPAVVNLENLINSDFGYIANFPVQGIVTHNITNVKLPRNKIALNCLETLDFNQEIQNAINKYIQIKNQQAQPQPQAKKTKPDNFVKLGQFFLDQNIQKQYEQNGSQVMTTYIFVGVAIYPSGYLIYTNQQNIAGWMYNGNNVRFLYYNNHKKDLERFQLGPDYATNLPISAFIGAAQAVSKYSKRASMIEFYNFPY